MEPLSNTLGKVMEIEGDPWVFRFANGLVVHTDPFMRPDSRRVLPVGGPQDMILNRLVNRPQIVSGKRVLDAFAGSGVLGLMALRLGAASVDFVDINPRAVRFTIENCARNGFSPNSFRAIEASVAEFSDPRPYDVVLANPPFVMTPPGIEGTLTSAAGPEGNDHTEMLVARLDDLLAAEGEAYAFILQLVVDGEPLIARTLPGRLSLRTVTLTPVQEETCPFKDYVAAYLRRFGAQAGAVREWERDLRARFGGALGVQHYIMRVPPRGTAPTTWSIVDNLATDYGAGFRYPVSSQADMALGRVTENFIIPSDGA
jgi:hypothetical protein